MQINPALSHVTGYHGFDWSFGTSSKAKKAKKKAKDEKRSEQVVIRAEKQASQQASEERQMRIQVQRQKAGNAMLTGGITLGGLALAGTLVYFAMRKPKKRTRR